MSRCRKKKHEKKKRRPAVAGQKESWDKPSHNPALQCQPEMIQPQVRLGPSLLLQRGLRHSPPIPGRVPVLIHPSLYRPLKLIFPKDVSGIVTNGWIMSNLGTGTPGQSVGVLTPADFRQVCV